MFATTVLDVAVGLVFTFLAVSLVVSAATEALASIFKWRSSTLLDGVKVLVNDTKFEGLARDLYNHALVNPRGAGKASTVGQVKFAPAYIDPKLFADALVDVVGMGKRAPAEIKQAIDSVLPATAAPGKIADPQLNAMLKGMVDRAGGDLEQVRTQIARWFDAGMDRVSGAYKRRAQLVSFLISLALVSVCDVDAIRIGESVWREPTLVQKIQANQMLQAEAALQEMSELGMPIGWTVERWDRVGFNLGTGRALLGWLLTAVAALFGAPFWFDTLQKVVRLKGAGPSAADKVAGTAAPQ